MKKTGKTIGERLMLLICVIILIPFYYLVVNTFKTPQEMTKSPLALPTSINLTIM